MTKVCAALVVLHKLAHFKIVLGVFAMSWQSSSTAYIGVACQHRSCATCLCNPAVLHPPVHVSGRIVVAYLSMSPAQGIHSYLAIIALHSGIILDR